jgi:hypothetical protein
MASAKVPPREWQEQNCCKDGKRKGAAKRMAATKLLHSRPSKEAAANHCKGGKRKGVAQRTATKVLQGGQPQMRAMEATESSQGSR